MSVNTKLVYKEGAYFKLNRDLLPESAKPLPEMQRIYTALYVEFQGAIDKDQYKNMNINQRLDAVDEFAKAWVRKHYK
jgi:hypothetical protein